MVEGLVKKGVDDAINHFFPVVEKRIKDTGVMWIASSEGGEACRKFGISMVEIQAVYAKLEEAFGHKITIFNTVESGGRVTWVMNRLRGTPGKLDLTEEERVECDKLFPFGKIGQAIRSAKVRLGLVQEDRSRGDDTDAKTPAPMAPGYIGDINVLLTQYQKWINKKYELESELEKVNKEIEKYKPLANVMSAAREAVKNIKQNGA